MPRFLAWLLLPLLLLIGISGYGYDVAALSCNVPVDYPDVATALANGCTNIFFSSNIVETVTVNIVGQIGILIDGNGYTWILQPTSSVRILSSRNIVLRDLVITRSAPFETIFINGSSDVVLRRLQLNLNTMWWYPGIHINISDNIRLRDVSVIDNGPGPRARIVVNHSNATLINTYLGGGFWGIELVDSPGLSQYSWVNITNLTVTTAHYGVIIRDYGDNNRTIWIRDSYVAGQAVEGIYGYFNNPHSPNSYTEVFIKNVTVFDSTFNNLFFEAYSSTRLNISIVNTTLIDADVWRNLVILASHNSEVNLEVYNLTVYEDSIPSFENIQLYSDSAAVFRSVIDGAYLSGPRDANIRFLTFGASMQIAEVEGLTGVSSQRYNLATYTRDFSSLYLNVSSSSFAGASDTNIVLYSSAGSSSQVVWLTDFNATAAGLNNMYLGATSNSYQEAHIWKAYLASAGIQNIKVDYFNNGGGSWTDIRDVNTTLSPWSLVYWSINSPGTKVMVYRSLLDRVQMWDVPGSTSLMVLNETVYDELNSVNNGGTILSKWTLRVRVVSSLTGFPIPLLPVSLYDSSTLVTLGQTGLGGYVDFSLSYLYDESNPFIDQLFIVVSTSYGTFQRGYLLYWGLSKTLPSWYGNLTMGIGVIYFSAAGHVEHQSMRIIVSGDQGWIRIYNDIPISMYQPVEVEVWSFRVLGYRAVDNFLIMWIRFTNPYIEGNQTMILDRSRGLLYSPGPIEIIGNLGW